MSPSMTNLPNNRQQPATIKRLNQNIFVEDGCHFYGGYQTRIACAKGVELYSTWDRPTPRLLCCNKAIANFEIFSRIKFAVRK